MNHTQKEKDVTIEVILQSHQTTMYDSIVILKILDEMETLIENLTQKEIEKQKRYMAF